MLRAAEQKDGKPAWVLTSPEVGQLYQMNPLVSAIYFTFFFFYLEPKHLVTFPEIIRMGLETVLALSMLLWLS